MVLHAQHPGYSPLGKSYMDQTGVGNLICISDVKKQSLRPLNEAPPGADLEGHNVMSKSQACLMLVNGLLDNFSHDFSRRNKF